MESLFLLAAAVLCAFASISSFLKKFNKTVPKILWSAAAVFVLTDLILLIYYLIGCRFDYLYVYNHISKSLPVIYRISALWSGQEGSFLLWAAVMAVTGFASMASKRSKSFGIFSAISFVIFLMCCVSQPFAKQTVVPSDGLGMAEALKDPWMVVHPPLVFIAYSAMGVLASLSVDIAEDNSVQRMQKWTLFCWVMLGLGIFQEAYGLTAHWAGEGIGHGIRLKTPHWFPG